MALISWLAPGAAVYVLARNFHVLGDKAASRRTIVWGGLFTVWFYGVWLYGEALYAHPITYFALMYVAFINAAHQIAQRRQMSSFAISHSKDFDVQSDEIVAGVIAAGTVALIAVLVLVSSGFESLIDS